MPDPKPNVAALDELLRSVRKKQVIARDEISRLNLVEAFLMEELRALGVYFEAAPASNGVNLAAVFNVAPSAAVNGAGGLGARLQGLAKHEAAEVVLDHLGKPASVPEIADCMRDHGYALKLSRKVLISSIRTAMDRKTDTFALGEQSKWRLLKWADKPSEA